MKSFVILAKVPAFMPSFLPEGYELPKSDSNYLDFQEGENRFRVLSDAIYGWLYWVDEKGNILSNPIKGCRTIYVRDLREIPASVQASPTLRPKAFWAFLVWNYQLEMVQVCKLTQMSVMRAMESYFRNPDWGSPLEYDFIIQKIGEGLNTKYQVLVGPKRPLDEGILAMYREMDIDLKAFFRGEDPFGTHENEPAQSRPHTNGQARPPVWGNGAYAIR